MDGNCLSANGKYTPGKTSDWSKKESLKLCEDFCFDEATATGCEYSIKDKLCLYHTEFLDLAANNKTGFFCLVIEGRNKAGPGDCTS